MRTLAKEIITAAAEAAGIATASVMDQPLTSSKVLHPMPRVEFQTVDEPLDHRGGISAVLAGTVPATHGRIRRMRYRRTIKVRVAIKSKDEDELESLASAFLAALPKRTVDSGGNRVMVRAEKAVRGGFGWRMAEPIKEREAAIYLTIAGGIYQDEDQPRIRSVNLINNVTWGE